MAARSRLVTWSVVPLLAIGAASWLLGIFGLTLTEWLLIWLVPGLVAFAAAVGAARDRTWAYGLEGLLGALVVMLFACLAYFTVGMTLAESGDFSEPGLVTPLGTLDGYGSLALYAAFLAAGAWLVAAAVLGIARRRAPTPVSSIVALLLVGCGLLGASGFGFLVMTPFAPVFALLGLALLAVALVVGWRASWGYVLELLVGLGLAASASLYVRSVIDLITGQIGSLDDGATFVVGLYSVFLVAGIGLAVAAIQGLRRGSSSGLRLEP